MTFSVFHLHCPRTTTSRQTCGLDSKGVWSMRFSAVVGVLFGLGALACTFTAGRSLQAIQNLAPSILGTSVLLGLSWFFLHGWGRQCATDYLVPPIPEGTEVTVCGGVRVTNPNDVSHASWQYTVEFIQSGNVRTRVVYPSEIDLPTGLAAAKGAMPAGTKLVLQSGWLVLKTQSTADSPAPRHLSGTPARS